MAPVRRGLSERAMAQRFNIHPDNPQVRLLRQVAQIIDHGGVGALPTDSCYALACHLDDKPAADRVRRIRQVDERHHLTLLCRDLSEIANYAKVDNSQYRLIRQVTPGPYAFILEATREVPRRLSHPSRKTIGIRIPDHPVTLGLLEVLGQPLLSTTLMLTGDELPLNDADHIVERLDHEIDFIVDGGACGVEPVTIVDLSGREPMLVRRGRGDVAALGLE
jgi:tRNA threonylcarbamoyl adenosine modification protein (Sua5/YciO/YrdC/YwlC family)